MSSAPSRSSGLRDRAERAYLTFFASSTDGTTAAVFRIGFGLLAVWQAIGVLLNLHRFYGRDGLIPWSLVARDELIWLSPFSWAPDSDAVLYLHAIAITVSSLALLVGLRPRVFTLVLAYFVMSLQFRNPMVLNSGDRLFMIVAALACAMPLSHRFSIDAWLRRRSNRPAPPMTVWGQRLVGLQIAYVYLSSAVAKLTNERWQNGRALRDVLASPVYAEWPRYVDSTVLIAFLTYSTLVFELCFPALVWFRRFRPIMLLWGVVFHLGIDVTMVIPIFSYIMIVSYAVYLTDDEVAWIVRLGRRSLQRLGL